MNILVIGNGGREHALAWKIRESPLCQKVYVAPGNAGTAIVAENVPIDVNDFEALGKFCLEQFSRACRSRPGRTSGKRYP